MTKYRVRIYLETDHSIQKVIEIEQPDRTNLAYSLEIPESWKFQHATPEK